MRGKKNTQFQAYNVLIVVFANSLHRLKRNGTRIMAQQSKSPIQLPYIEQFKHGLAWNLIDSIGSQGLVIMYHFFFRYFFGLTVHGIMGCILSTFYLAVIVCNMGLDLTFAPFLELFTRTHRTMRSLLFTLIIPQLLIVMGTSGLLYVLYLYVPYVLPLFTSIEAYLTPSLIKLICITFICESMRKTFRYFLKLCFYAQFTAWAELIGMMASVLFIISQRNIAHAFILERSWVGLCVLSATQLLILTIGIVHMYLQLRSHNDAQDTTHIDTHGLFSRIIKTRLFTWANQCLHQLFSGNFLVPICALKFGLEQASLMKVITSIAAWITLIAQKGFGISGNALLAHLKSSSLKTQQAAFSYLTFLLNQALYFLLIFLLINGKKIVLLQVTPTAAITWSLLYLMLILSFFESFFILYEKWYILEEQAHYYFFFNGLSFALLYSILHYLHSPHAILLMIITLRVATFIIITLLSFYQWHILPSLKPRLETIIASCIVAAGCYLFL